MDFDHRDPEAKSFRLTSGRAMLASADALAAEAAKCDVVCANCHRVRTAHRASRRVDPADAGSSQYLERKRQYWRAQARLLSELKSAPCTDCARTFAPCAMDFDHREPETKRFTVSRMIGRVGTKTIVAEIAKCDIVCANCHRERTYRRREGGSCGRE
jgi:hypothetical protein